MIQSTIVEAASPQVMSPRESKRRVRKLKPMRQIAICLKTFGAALLLMPAFAAPAPFQNLGFDDANLSALMGEGTFGTVSDLLPGWSLRNGTYSIPLMSYDAFAPDWPVSGGDAVLVSPTNVVSLPVVGEFSLSLTPPQNQTMLIEQTGAVPEGTQSIQLFAFEAPSTQYMGPKRDFLAVSLDGTAIDLYWRLTATAHSPWSGTSIWSWTAVGDVSSFAGREAELRITTKVQIDSLGSILRYGIDSIEFSPEPIPEPPVSMLLMAALFVCWCLPRHWRLRFRVTLRGYSTL